MHTGTSYRLFEFLDWTRRDIYVLIVLGIVPVVAYQTGNMKWLGIPWTVVSLLGTATAFIVGSRKRKCHCTRSWRNSSLMRSWRRSLPPTARMYTSLGRVGESTESPFEGSANDIPISQMCRAVEIDLRDVFGEMDLPSPLEPRNNIVL